VRYDQTPDQAYKNSPCRTHNQIPDQVWDDASMRRKGEDEEVFALQKPPHPPKKNRQRHSGLAPESHRIYGRCPLPNLPQNLFPKRTIASILRKSSNRSIVQSVEGIEPVNQE